MIREHSRPLARAASAVLLTGVCFGFVFAYRTDYLGHYVAGVGGTLLLLAPVIFLPPRVQGAAVVTGVLLAVGLGWGTEATIFRLAIFDPVDFFNQSLGATLAGAIVLGQRRSVATFVGVATIALVALFAGFFFAFE